MSFGMGYLKAAAIAGALILAPLTASAFTVSPASNIANGGSYDIGAGPYFWDATFLGGEGAGSISFTFGNSIIGDTTFGVTQGTVLQFSGQFDGVTISWGNGESQSVAPGQNAIINISTYLLNGASDVLTLSWGAVTGTKANIDLDIAAISAVPVPAGGLLLLTGLGGLVLARRKRKAA